MHILGFLLIIIIAIFIIGLSIIGTLLRTLFGFGKRSSSHTHTGQQRQYGNPHMTNNDTAEATKATVQAQHKKIFTKDEGEYVDFEEVR